MSAEAHSRGEDPRARAARHRGRAADLRKQAEIEEAWAAELDGEATASAPDRERAPVDVPGNDVSPPRPPPPAEQLGAGEIKSWGAAAPSTIDVYLDQWTDYFATDPCWYNIVCALKKRAESEPDAPTHQVLCRRLAAAVAPMFVGASGADPIQSWGPAPPSTSADYATTWGQYVAALLGRARPEGSSTREAPSEQQAPLIPPPPPAPPRPIDAEARAVLPTVTPSPAPWSEPAPPQPMVAEAAAMPMSTSVAEAHEVPPLPAASSLPRSESSPTAPSPRWEAPPAPSSPSFVARPPGTASRRPAVPRAVPAAPLAPARLLTIAEAAAYCGFRTTGALRKARLEGRVVAAGRRGGAGTWMWDVAESRSLPAGRAAAGAGC